MGGSSRGLRHRAIGYAHVVHVHPLIVIGAFCEHMSGQHH